ncbi:tetratricopeptide repeat protein [Roseateles sp. P5_E4]
MTVDRLSRLLDYLAHDPRNPTLLADVADEQLQMGDWAAARSTLQQLLEIQPGDALARYRLAVAERAGGDAAKAVTLLRELVTEGHSHPAVLQELARSHAQQGDWAEVAPTLAGLKAIELPPGEGDAVWLLRIRAHHHVGALEDALAEAKAWEAGRGAALPLQGQAAIATLLLDAERIDEAAQLLSRVDARAIEGHAELAAAAGFVELSQGHAAVALERFAQSAHVEPQLGRAHLGRGLALASQGQLPQATEALKVAVEVAPSHLGSWHALAWLQLLAGDLDGAAASFEAALAQDANFGETHGGLALIAALRGNRDAAERHLRTASKLDPRSTNVLVAKTVLERGPDALDAQWLARALERFMGMAASRNPALRAMLEKMTARLA